MPSPRSLFIASLAVLGLASGALLCCSPAKADPPWEAPDAGPPTGDGGAANDSSLALDVGPTARLDGGVTAQQLGCSLSPLWQIVAPFSEDAPIAVAPRAAWPAAMLAEETCAYGQAACTELVFPVGKNPEAPNLTVTPVSPEGAAFAVQFRGDPAFEACTRTLFLQPSAAATTVVGALQIGTGASSVETSSASPLLLKRDLNQGTTAPPEILVTPADRFDPLFTTSPVADAPKLRVTQNRLYIFDGVRGSFDARDVTTGASLAFGPTPTTFASVREHFAVAGDLWLEATRPSPAPATGVELWRVDARGTYTPMLQKAGIDVTGATTDGLTLFWIEQTTSAPPRVELWSAVFAKTATTLANTGHRLTGLAPLPGPAPRTVAHAGYFALVASPQEILVVRARDGALQRIAIAAPGTAADVAYVDETAVWVLRDAPTAGLLKIALNSWP